MMSFSTQKTPLLERKRDWVTHQKWTKNRNDDGVEEKAKHLSAAP